MSSQADEDVPMQKELIRLIDDISIRMRLLRSMGDARTDLEELTEREIMLLELVSDRGFLNISEIAAAFPDLATSTISMTVTRLWREKGLVAKQVDPDNQRITLVSLTAKGKGVLEKIKANRTERFHILLEALNLDEQEHRVMESVISRAIAYLDSMLPVRPPVDTEDKEVQFLATRSVSNENKMISS